VMALLILGSWGALVHTTYGVLLLVKLGLFAVVAAIGAYNHFALVRRVETAGTRMLRRTLVAELVVIVAIVGVTGALTATSPNDTSKLDAFAVARKQCLEQVAAMLRLPGMENMDHWCPGDPTTTTSSTPFDPTDSAAAVVSDRFGDGTAVVTVAPGKVGSNEV